MQLIDLHPTSSKAPSESVRVVYLPEVARDSRFDGINERLTKLESENPARSNQDGWLRRNSHWVFPIVTILFGSGFIFGFLKWFFGDLVDHRIDSKLTEPSKQIGELQKLHERIEGRLDGIADLLKIVAQSELKRTSQLSIPEFQRDLPEVQNALTVARKEEVPKAPETMNALRSKFQRVDKESRGYWGAATAFVNYRSDSPPSHIDNCSNNPLKFEIEKLEGNPDNGTGVITHGPFVFTNCELNLGNAETIGFLAKALQFADVHVVRGFVTYNGGPVELPPPLLMGRYIGKLILEQCTYNISVSEQSPAPLKRLVTSMVAANTLALVKAF